jgi:hypothetical protein
MNISASKIVSVNLEIEPLMAHVHFAAFEQLAPSAASLEAN